MTSRLLRALAALVVVALAFAGCGGDDDDGAAGGNPEVDAEDLEDLEGAAAAAGADEDCIDALAAFASVSAGAGAMGDGSPEDLEQSLETFEAYADAAPDEIADDLQLLAAAYRSFVEIMVEAGYDPASGEAPDEEMMEAMTEALEGMTTEEVTAASENVSAYFEEHCGTE